MERPRVRLVLLPGGKRGEDGASIPRLPRAALRVVPGGPTPDVAAAIREAIEAARQMRLEIERRIARALDTLHDGS